MRAQHKKSQHLQIILLRNLTYRKKVTQRFRHFLIINIQKPVMHPVPGKFFSACRLRLRDFIFMMRKDQIFSSCMNIDRIAQIFFRHHRAFNMPSRTSLSPWRLPCRFAFFFRFPEYKIERLFFQISRYFNIPMTSLQIFQIFMRQLSIGSKFASPVIYRSVCCGISKSFVYQRADHFDHTVDLLRRQRVYGCRQNIHAFHILFALRNITAGNLTRIHSFLLRLFNDLIVHVRKI